MAEYMIVENNIVTGIFCGVAEKGSITLPKNHEVRVGESLDFYNSNYTRKTEVQLIKEKLIELPQGYKIDNDKLVEMTYEERIIAGLESLPYGMKIVDNNLVAMTEEEKVAAMTIEEKAAYHRQKRDTLLNAEVWKVERHNQEILLGRETTLSNDEFMNLLRYIQELRDLTEQPNFPNEVIYPTL